MNNYSNDNLVDVNSIEKEEITPKDLLKFAKLILLWLMIIFILSAICELFYYDSGIFEVCKTLIPPIATSIIGFYFGKN